MFTREIEFLETLKETNDIQIEDIDNMIFNLENFDALDYFRTLDNSDIIEAILALLELLENNERENAKKAIRNDNGFYNSDLKKAENNIEILSNTYNLLCYELQ